MTRLLGAGAFLGVSPSSLLRADPHELPLLVEAMEHTAKYQQERDKALARLIINELGQALKKGKR